jgi:hypothetical protein
MNKLIAVLLIILTVQLPAQEVVSALRHPASGPVWALLQTGVITNCPTTGTTCTAVVSSTTAGSVLVASLAQGTAANITLSSASGGGGTWVLCPTHSCNVFNSVGIGIDLVYNISGTGGATSITATYSAVCAVCFVSVDEWQCTANCGTIALDQIAASSNNTSCTSCTASSFSGLTGTSDLLIQLAAIDNAQTDSTYLPYLPDANENLWYVLGSVATAAPVVSQTPTGYFVSSGVAFK